LHKDSYIQSLASSAQGLEKHWCGAVHPWRTTVPDNGTNIFLVFLLLFGHANFKLT
jgi:hypothetical protein